MTASFFLFDVRLGLIKDQNAILVRLVNIVNSEDGQITIITEIAEGNSSARFNSRFGYGLFGKIKTYGNAKEIAIYETVVLDDSIVCKKGIMD